MVSEQFTMGASLDGPLPKRNAQLSSWVEDVPTLAGRIIKGWFLGAAGIGAGDVYMGWV